MNIVEQAARIIDPEAFETIQWVDQNTGKEPSFAPLERCRREYRKSSAVSRAVKLLQLAAKTENLKCLLAEDETERWKLLGIPESVLQSSEVQGIIANKFQ